MNLVILCCIKRPNVSSLILNFWYVYNGKLSLIFLRATFGKSRPIYIYFCRASGVNSDWSPKKETNPLQQDTAQVYLKVTKSFYSLKLRGVHKVANYVRLNCFSSYFYTKGRLSTENILSQ